MNTIYIGYDENSPVTYHVCSNSIIRKSTTPVALIPLVLPSLPYNETHTDGSNRFVYSRFLVPYLQNFTGWALFIDGDMVVTDDITTLFTEFLDPSKGVVVVKHSYTTNSKIKYLNHTNDDYPRKNWSSVILWNCSYYKNKILTPKTISESTGSFLHRFSWLDDFEIGELPIEWNWLPDEFGENPKAKIIHYTLGAPCFNGYETTPMNELWHQELKNTIYCVQ
jgi:lipopolysaccharide biosynthesis glycosyltransferase